MKLHILTLAAFATATPVHAQEQQAGNSASANADDTFQALMEKCDDIDTIMLRNRLRVQIPRITEEAAASAQELMDQGMATCGEGDLDGAKAVLNEALEIAAQGASENFGTDSTETQEAEDASATEETAETEAEAAKPWWQFW